MWAGAGPCVHLSSALRSGSGRLQRCVWLLVRHAEDGDPSDLERWDGEHHTLLLIQKSHTHLMSVVQEEEEGNRYGFHGDQRKPSPALPGEASAVKLWSSS